MDFLTKKQIIIKRLTGFRPLLCSSSLLRPLFWPPCFFPTAAQAATSMKHETPDYFVPDQRIRMEAQVEDPQGVNLVRCYFKAAGEADLVFVAHEHDRKKMNMPAFCRPRPSPPLRLNTSFSRSTAQNRWCAARHSRSPKNPAKGIPDWQEVPKEGEIKVSMEVGQPIKELPGFSDNVTVDMVESVGPVRRGGPSLL